VEKEIKTIIVEEFSVLIDKIESDFISNYERKINNFLLSQMDQNITANMVFVSSFESKSGFVMEECAKRIARLRYGYDNVPNIVNPRNLKHSMDETSLTEQIVVTDVDTDNGNLRGEIAAFRANNEAKGRGGNRVESQVHQKSIKEYLLPLSQKYKTDYIYTKPVDLAFFDGKNWNIMELKAGGDLDSSNAPSNIEKLLTIYVDMGIENCHAYFSTIYNKDGEGNTWTGAVKKHLNYPSMFLIGSKFWEAILPNSISFAKFQDLYKEALEEINLNHKINEMINWIN
jgi:hypothetical protein